MAAPQSISSPSNPQGVEYRDVHGFPGYLVGNDGSVWSCWEKRALGDGGGTEAYQSDRWHRLSQRPISGGYLSVSMQATDEHGKRVGRTKLVHQLVLIAFVGPRPKGMVSRHGEKGQLDNSVSNLCWGTQKENIGDQIRAGTFVKGSRNGKAIVTEEQVAEAKRLIAAGVRKRIVVEQTGITPAIYSNIKQGNSWKEVAPASEAV